jgi:hypothetical protein
MPKAKAKPKAEENGAALRLEWRDPAELAENPRNWRRHPEPQMAALTDVLAEVGWAGACLYNERTGRLIDGHARRKVALEQGAAKVPVLVGDWDEAQEATILATLDPLAAMASADAAKLDALLREVDTGSEALQGMLAELAEGMGAIPERLPAEPANDPREEWQGMPEFEHEDQSPWKTLTVHFKDAAALEEFAALVNQTVTEGVRSIWFPEAEIGRIADKRYVDEP